MITIIASNLLGRRVHVTRSTGIAPTGQRLEALDFRGEVVLILYNGQIGVEEDGTGQLHWPHLLPDYDGTVVRLLHPLGDDYYRPRDPASSST